jgi:phosphoribosyl 1,2-cyclic phosphate phosphodiesterase
MRVTLLGTGTSMGIPQIGCACAVCRSTDPRDRRGRTAALVEAGGTTLLIDTPPELRLQLLGAGVRHLDAVLYTHEHADHVNGIDDLRVFSVARRGPLPVYASAATQAVLREGYRYIFDDAVEPVPGTSKPRLEFRDLAAGRAETVGGLRFVPLAFEHGHSTVLGFRFGRFAYLTDVKRVPEAERERLRGVEVLVLNALWWRPHPTHLSFPEAIETAQAIGARRTILTHLTHETGHAELAARLPDGIEPGYDGETLEIAE